MLLSACDMLYQGGMSPDDLLWEEMRQLGYAMNDDYEPRYAPLPKSHNRVDSSDESSEDIVNIADRNSGGSSWRGNPPQARSKTHNGHNEYPAIPEHRTAA
jgi:hypothetical protein